MLNIALFGPAGAGKGTQSKLLMEKYDLVYIATGDILRREIKKKSAIGKKIKAVVDKGGLVSDEIIVQIIKQEIKKNPGVHGFLFDGFPRTYVQAYIFDGLLQLMHTSLSCMLSLEVPNKILKERLMKRAQISHRNDDTEQVIDFRLQEYERKTIPVADYYKEKKIYYPIDGLGTVDEVFKRVSHHVDLTLKNALLNIILYGYPGAGKGTQAKLIAEKFGLVYISIGKILREEMRNDSEMGKEANTYIKHGLFVPDEIVIKLIESKFRMNPNAKGYVFKGFPRTMIQTYILEGLLLRLKTSVSCIINLDVSPLESIRRLTLRGKTKNSRDYDLDIEAIIKRLEEYEEKTIPVRKFYKNKSKVVSINGIGSEDEIFQRIVSSIKKAHKIIK